MKIDAMSNAGLAHEVPDEPSTTSGAWARSDSDPGVMTYPVHSRNIKGGTQGNRSRYSNPEIDGQLDAAARRSTRRSASR